jgi:serine O-acetyltransferase
MVVLFLVKVFGGIWRIKGRCCHSRVPPLRSFYRLLWSLWMRQNGSFIEFGTPFANRPCFPHGIRSVFISGDASIGRNCVIFQQVIIGSSFLPGSKRCGAPIIGDDCLIGAGAKIIGRVRLGNQCRVGAGCVVSHDIPDNSVVVTAPARVIARTEPLRNCYYMQRSDGWYYYSDEAWIKESDPALIRALVAPQEA